MAYTQYPQSSENNQARQERSEFKRRSLGDVRQDNNAFARERMPSPQSYRSDQWARSHPLGINSDRSKKHSTKRRTVPAMGWVGRPISEEIDRIALREGL